MRYARRVLAVLACAAMPSAAVAQTVSEAFECNLPYPGAIAAVGKLDLLKQSDFSFPGLRTSHTIMFAPGSSRVFGHLPKTLVLELKEPKANDPDRTILATFSATFDPDTTVNKTILSSVTWALVPCIAGLDFCVRENNPYGMLGYSQKPDELRLTCEYKFREDELPG